MIDKETLSELYITKRLTSYEIAEFFNVDRSTVCRWLKFYEIDINPKQRKYELIKKVPFTQEQKEMIVGTLLGDGCISPHGRKNKSYRLMIGHCEKQKDLVFWKKAMLGNFVNVVSKREDKRKNSIMYTFNTVVHDEFKFYYNLFYENHQKIIRTELINYVTPLSIAVWFSDDGSINKNVNMRLATDGFTKKENEFLQEMLKTKFGIRCKICTYIRHENEFHFLSFNKVNSELLTELIKPYVIDCMKYKIMNRSSTTECQTSDNKDEDIV